MHDDVQRIDDRLQGLESVILDDPAKALETTLIRQDLDDLRARSEFDMDNLRTDFARVYDFSKWFLVAIISLSVGLLGIAISIFKGRDTHSGILPPNGDGSNRRATETEEKKDSREKADKRSRNLQLVVADFDVKGRALSISKTKEPHGSHAALFCLRLGTTGL